MVYIPSLVFLLLVIEHNLHSATAASTKKVSDATAIHFPGHFNARIREISNKFGTDDVPEECKNQTYCTIKPTDYPEEDFNKMFSGLKTLPTPSLVPETILASRHGGPEEQDDCDSIVTFEPIYRARTKRGSEWMNVVQAPAYGYEQRIRLEICEQPSAPCFNMFPPTADMKVFCSQKYSRWEMLILNGTETKKIAVDLPTCCSCVYKTVSLEARFGTSLENVTPVKKPSKKLPVKLTV